MSFQSTFPRGERPIISVPAKGKEGHFNPRSLVGNDDLLPYIRIAPMKYFNPRSLVGNDLWYTPYRWEVINFNPRSLVGNDLCPVLIVLHKDYFNPRSLVGNDATTPSNRFVASSFQSTFPRGERHRYAETSYTDEKNFNPRSLVGNDTGRFPRSCRK